MPTPHVRVSLLCLDGVDVALRPRLRDEMASAGVDLIADAGPGSCAACLVLATDASSTTAAAVSRVAHRGGRIVVVTVGGSSRDGGIWQLLRAGADDVIAWMDARVERVTQAVAARLRRWDEVDRSIASPDVQRHLVGHSDALLATLRQLVEVAWLPDVPVLITGESGTGKELGAQLIHSLDRRASKRDLVTVDCTTIVPTLSGSELFGHERGAFTDAIVARDGAVTAADGGTLFLDEMGELPLALQAELLRVIQEGTYKRVGGSVWRTTRFRLICATNRDLQEDVASGRFRADLYHRIAGWTIRLPTLAERLDDIPELVRHFIHQLRPDLQDPVVDPVVDELLTRRPYPGNVRELRQLVARICGRHVGPAPITAGDVPADERPIGDQQLAPVPVDVLRQWARAALQRDAALRDIRKAAEDAAIDVALEDADGNLHRASRRLKVTDRALQLRRAAARRAQ